MTFALSERDFARLASIATSATGIQLGPAKQNMMASRLGRRLRELGLADFGSYVDLVEADEGERRRFINAMTTNLTGFFREAHHFEHLRTTALPQLMAARATERRLRIWSAGCSTGQEPYSIAMVLAKSLGDQTWDARILATDVDSDVLGRASRAVYPLDAVQSVPKSYRTAVQRGCGTREGDARVVPDVVRLVTFRELNLLGPWPMKQAYDVIFCRNVAIYFDRPTKERLLDRFRSLLAPDGWLYIGHSETIQHDGHGFRPMGQTIYRRAA